MCAAGTQLSQTGLPGAYPVAGRDAGRDTELRDCCGRFQILSLKPENSSTADMGHG